MKWIIYDNPFMKRLFPEIKQQKPGRDLYVYVATIQIILVIYVFIFYANMQGNETDIATQFASNQYSSHMVILLIVIICIMLVDRVLYSTHAFLSGSRLTYEEVKSPLLIERKETGVSQDTSVLTSNNETDMSVNFKMSGQPYGRRT